MGHLSCRVLRWFRVEDSKPGATNTVSIISIIISVCISISNVALRRGLDQHPAEPNRWRSVNVRLLTCNIRSTGEGRGKSIVCSSGETEVLITTEINQNIDTQINVRSRPHPQSDQLDQDRNFPHRSKHRKTCLKLPTKTTLLQRILPQHNQRHKTPPSH